MVDESLDFRCSQHTFTPFDCVDLPSTGLRRSTQQALRISGRMAPSNDIVFLPGLGGGMAVNTMPAELELPKCWDFQKTCAVLYLVRVLGIKR